MSDQSDKIKILIVDDIADTRDNIEKLLFFEKDMQVVGKAATGREAVDMAKQIQPDIVLMDINMPDMDGIAATEAISSQLPNTQVIMMSVQGETDYMRRAMLVGARDFLTKPISGDLLYSTIRDVYRVHKNRRIMIGTEVNSDLPESTGQVIAVYSPKGGTGKSAVASNLAVALKLLPGNRKVCLMDANLLFGDIVVMFNISTDKTINDLTSRINEIDEELIEDVMYTHTSQVKILVAPPNPQEGELVTAEHIRIILDHLKRYYDYIVVDTQSSFQDQTMAVLDMAEKILALMVMDLPSIKNIRQFLEVAELLDYPDDKVMLVVNKADGSYGLRVEQVAQNLNHEVVAQIANAHADVVKSVNNGVPLIIDQQSHRVSRDIINLAYIITGKSKSTEKPKSGPQQAKKEEPRGLFARLTKR